MMDVLRMKRMFLLEKTRRFSSIHPEAVTPTLPQNSRQEERGSRQAGRESWSSRQAA